MAQELASMFVRLGLQSKEFRDGISKANKQLGGLDREARKADKGVGMLGKGMKTLGAGLAAFVGFRVIKSSITDFIVAAGKQEKAVAGMDQAMRSMGKYSPALRKTLLDTASAIQATTTFGDEAVIAGQKFLLTYKDIGTDVLPRASRTMADLAALMGGDTVQAANMLGKASMGMTGELRRVGITVDRATFESEGFLGVLREIEAQVGGQAVALAATGYGGLEQLGNVAGDTKERLGDLILLELEDSIKGWVKWIGDFNAILQEFIDERTADKYADSIVQALNKSGKVEKSWWEKYKDWRKRRADYDKRWEGTTKRLHRTIVKMYSEAEMLADDYGAAMAHNIEGTADLETETVGAFARIEKAAKEMTKTEIEELEAWANIDEILREASVSESIRGWERKQKAAKEALKAMEDDMEAWGAFAVATEEEVKAAHKRVHDDMQAKSEDVWDAILREGNRWKAEQMQVQAEVLDDFYTVSDNMVKKAKEALNSDAGIKGAAGSMEDWWADMWAEDGPMAKKITGTFEMIGDAFADAFVGSDGSIVINAEKARDALKDVAGEMVKEGFRDVIKALVGMIGAQVASMVASAMQKGATAGGSAGAWTEGGSAVAAALFQVGAGWAIGESLKAEGGWVASHPGGGWIDEGSGFRDDVFLGATPGVRHWGMGGEYVINKDSARQHAALIEAINRDRGWATGGYVDIGHDAGGMVAQIPWEPVADWMAIGAGASFLHGAYKGAGWISGLVEMISFLITTIGTTFGGKAAADAIGNAFLAEGGWLNKGYGLIPGITLPGEEYLPGGKKDPLGDFIKDIIRIDPLLGDLAADDLEWLSGKIGAMSKMNLEDAWDKIVVAIRTPLMQVSKDMVEPFKYYTEADKTLTDITTYLKDEFLPPSARYLGLHEGTDYVPETGMYMLEEGEAVTSREDNRPIHITLEVDGTKLGEVIYDGTKDGSIQFHERGLVDV